MKKTCLLFAACFAAATASSQAFVDRSVATAEAQTQLMIEKAAKTLEIPCSASTDGTKMHYANIEWWTSGFFPGTLWYMYELTGDNRWKAYARIWNQQLEPLRTFNKHHDVGFMVGCSFGNGYRLTGDPEYRQIIIDASDALCTRFNEKLGVIKSWNSKDQDKYLVIIDNMMNLEMLMMAYRLTGDKKYYDVAITHADTTLKHHFRPDGSSYHVVDYNPNTGKINLKRTHQGYSDDSAWARGQSWGLYGYTMMYRETGDVKYLQHAEKIAGFILNHKNLPEDYVFYWDFDAPDIPDAPRDASAAAITASALIELSGYSASLGKTYMDAAHKILESLSKPPYLAPIGENQNFILTSSVGALPLKSQITVPLDYADYYFVEALVRYRNYQRSTENSLTTAKQ